MLFSLMQHFTNKLINIHFKLLKIIPIDILKYFCANELTMKNASVNFKNIIICSIKHKIII